MQKHWAKRRFHRSAKRYGDNLDEQLERVANLNRVELIERWDKMFGCLPYKGIRNPTLIRALVYQVQIKLEGGLKPSMSNKLIKLAKTELRKNQEGQAQNHQPHVAKQTGNHFNRAVNFKPQTQLGCRLVREWNGRTYEVVVADKGYILNGITHRSLSACAKAITGAHWSGPRFFGVET